MDTLIFSSSAKKIEKKKGERQRYYMRCAGHWRFIIVYDFNLLKNILIIQAIAVERKKERVRERERERERAENESESDLIESRREGRYRAKIDITRETEWRADRISINVDRRNESSAFLAYL